MKIYLLVIFIVVFKLFRYFNHFAIWRDFIIVVVTTNINIFRGHIAGYRLGFSKRLQSFQKNNKWNVNSMNL